MSRRDGFYIVEGNVVRPEKTVFLPSSHHKNGSEGIQLWHKSLGHVGKHAVATMSKGHTLGVDGGAKADVISCIASIDAKKTRTACNGLLATKSEDYVVQPDIIGPVGLSSWGGSWYILRTIAERP